MISRFIHSAAAAAGLIALLGQAPALAAAPAPAARCELQLLAELPVSLEDGSPTVEAQINGKPARLFIDTGSDMTLLFRHGAAQLGLATRPAPGARFYGVGGGDDARSARVETLRIGQLTARDEDLLVVGRGDMGAVLGVLGATFLLQGDLEFDLPEGKIRLFRPKNCDGDEVVYWGQAYAVAPMRPVTDDSIQLTVQVNGAPIRAQLDSGADLSTMTLQGAARAGMTPGSAGMTADADSIGMGPGKVKTWVGVFPTFGFGEETIRNAKLRVADLFGEDTEKELGSNLAVKVVDSPQMLLGADFLRSHRVYVSRSQRRIYASYEGGPVFRLARTAPASADAPKGAGPGAGQPTGDPRRPSP